MKTRRTSSSRLVRLLRKSKQLRRDERGVTAVEFGLLALPFFALMGATLETGVVMLASNIFESAVHDSSRLIRTGQAQNLGYGSAEFKSEICDRGFGLFDCTKIKVSVRTLIDFGSAATVTPVDVDTGAWTFTENFQAGGAREVVIAEAYYKWDTILDVMGFNLGSLSDGTLLMGTARVWRNEPFGS